jgi:hypothetical protein
MQQPMWTQILPFAIIALVIWQRWKGISVPRPLKVGQMWIVPVLYSALVGFMLWAMPPSIAGWEVFAGGVLLGSIIGWQRARLMHLHIDDTSGAIMLRQSPAGLAVIVGIFLLRRLFLPSQGGGAQSGGPVVQGAHPALPLLTDGLLGFALGMIVGYSIELWRRAIDLRVKAA